MATAKIILHTIKIIKGGKHPVVIRITKDRARKYYTIGKSKSYACKLDDWDIVNSQYRKSFQDYDTKNAVLRNEIAKANKVIDTFKFEDVEFSFDKFDKLFLKKSRKNNVSHFFDETISDYLKAGRIGYADIFKYTKYALFRFNSEDLRFSDITSEFLEKFETNLRANSVKPNSIFVYMRTLRTLLNKAIKANYMKLENYPFSSQHHEGYSIEGLKEKTRKRAISIEEMNKIINLKTVPGTGIFHAKNFFLFSFYTMGMAFHDIAHLKWSDITNGILKYYRQKSGSQITAFLQPEAKAILKYYKSNSIYIFPILTEDHKTPEQQYRRVKNALKKVLIDLKTIGEELEIVGITTYVTRHSWATILHKMGAPIGKIQQGMGHKTPNDTSIYLKEFENEEVDSINAKMIKTLKKNKK
jgi:integrase/recombinase XerD